MHLGDGNMTSAKATIKKEIETYMESMLYEGATKNLPSQETIGI